MRYTGNLNGARKGVVKWNMFGAITFVMCGVGTAFGGFPTAPIFFQSHGDLTNVSITNTGVTRGQNGGFNFGDSDAVNIWAGEFFFEHGSIYGASIVNSGGIYGGASNGDQGSYGGTGIFGFGTGGVRQISLLNSGQIAGGQGYYGGNAIIFSSFYPYGTIADTKINNTGSIAGGLGIDNGGGAIYLGAERVMNLTIVNHGSIFGGAGLNGDGGVGISLSAENLSNIAITNYGTIRGGNSTGHWFGGDGVELWGHATPDAGPLVVNNYGKIIGGTAESSRDAGRGIAASANNLTINNWGEISAGSGKHTASIDLWGDGNTINLYRHSVLNGSISARGNDNVLNFVLTGISPELRAELARYATGSPVAGHVVIHGKIYKWDPMIVEVNTSSYELQGKTPNQRSIGANLDSFQKNPTGDMLSLLNAVDNSGKVSTALEAFSPQRFQIYEDVALSNANLVTRQIDGRLDNVRDGSESVDTAGFGGIGEKLPPVLGKDGKELLLNGTSQRRWGFFASGDGTFADVNGHGGDLQDASFNSAGMLTGVDAKIGDSSVAGLLFSYHHADADLDAEGSRAKVDSYTGGVYGSRRWGAFYGNGLFAYSHNGYDSSRNIVFPGVERTANGSTEGNQYVLNLDGGYDRALSESLTLTPVLGLQYVRTDVNGFTESGAGAASLDVGGQSMDSLRSSLGVNLVYRKQVSKALEMAADLRVAWQHEFLDNGWLITGGFDGSGLGAFSVRTTSPDRDAALLGVGVNATVRERATVYLEYDAQAGQANYFEQSVDGGVRVEF